jgi:hypothetical protein
VGHVVVQHLIAGRAAMTSPADEEPTATEADAAELAIATALTGLDDVAERPVSEHVERFEAAHATLTDALSDAERLLSSSRGDGS